MKSNLKGKYFYATHIGICRITFADQDSVIALCGDDGRVYSFKDLSRVDMEDQTALKREFVRSEHASTRIIHR